MVCVSSVLKELRLRVVLWIVMVMLKSVKPVSGLITLLNANLQIYHSLFWPLEFTVPNRDNNKCYSKIICNKLDSVSITLGPFLICIWW